MAEVVSPLRDTVRFVDGETGERQFAHDFRDGRSGRRDILRGNVNNTVLAIEDLFRVTDKERLRERKFTFTFFSRFFIF